MYVKRLFYDLLKELPESEKCIKNPTWQQVEMVINKLDGDNVTQITMDNGNEDNYLCIGGGNHGLCNIFISTNDNEVINTLIKTEFDHTLVHKLVTGGQEGDFEDRLCVSMDIAKRVAKTYYESGKKDELFVWE